MIRYVTSKIKKVFTKDELTRCKFCGNIIPEGIIGCLWCNSGRDRSKCEKSNKEE
jgi:hypothetical protein